MLHRRFGFVAWLVPALIAMLAAVAVADYAPDPSAPREEVPADYRWDPYHIFPDNEAWEAELAAIAEDIPKLNAFKGRLSESGAVLRDAFEAVDALSQRFYRVYMYSQTLYDVDQGVSEHRTMDGRVKAMFPAFGEATSWMQPEILEMDRQVIRNFMAEEQELQIYDYYFEELWRQKDRTLTAPEERLMSLTGNMRGAPKSAYDALLGVDMDFPDVVNAEGKTVPMTVSGWAALRSSDAYNTRVQARDAFFGTLRSYENTFAAMLDGVVKGHIMNKQARGYDSCLEASLAPDNISTDAYRMLIDTVRGSLPQTMHKYVELRRKVMGLDGKLTFPNLYNAMMVGVEPEYSYDDARQLIEEGLKPMGKEYGKLLAEGMDPANGWIDVYPNENKRSGAYSAGVLARDLHPYVLHNYDNSLDAVSTTAHEMGHALHSVLSSRTQPSVYSGYTTFLAEVASTANEALLTNHMLAETDDVDFKLLLLNQRLESIRLTIFRQTLFADFELRFHEHAEQGNPLTADYLNSLYAELVTDYYGPGFEMAADDECEWMFIPHFYYNFYVFTYATGLTSGLAIADLITEQGEEAAQRYINNMLKAGSSAPPLEILRSAGVDLETPAPIVAAMDAFAETVAEFDRLWTQKYGKM